MESEILMYVVAKAVEPTGTTITLASAQGDAVCLRFSADEHLSDLYGVGDEVLATVHPRLRPTRQCAAGPEPGHRVETRRVLRPSGEKTLTS